MSCLQTANKIFFVVVFCSCLCHESIQTYCSQVNLAFHQTQVENIEANTMRAQEEMNLPWSWNWWSEYAEANVGSPRVLRFCISIYYLTLELWALCVRLWTLGWEVDELIFYTSHLVPFPLTLGLQNLIAGITAGDINMLFPWLKNNSF